MQRSWTWLRFAALALFLSVAGSPSLVAQPETDGIDYFGQRPPAWTPELFAPGLVSTGLNEFSPPMFSPDGTEVLFHIADNDQRVILRLRKVDGRWTGPEVVPFSGLFSDVLPVYSPDGTRIHFRSRRPLTPDGEPMPDFHSWVVARDGDDWGTPRRYPGLDLCVIGSFAADGTLYCSSAVEGEGRSDLFRAEPESDGYGELVSLGAVNTPGDELRPSVAPDECCLVYQSYGGPRGSGPLVSFRGADGAWSDGLPLRETYEAHPWDRFPHFSPDGEHVFFIGWRFRQHEYREEPLSHAEIMERLRGPQNLRNDVYWLGARILEQLRPEAGLDLAGDYLGQQPPGLVSELFAPGIVSTGIHEHSGANFSPDGDELFFVAAGVVYHTLIRMERREDGSWTRPAVAPFSGHYHDDCPSFTPDGKRLYFQSRRPRDGGREARDDWGTWYVEKTETGWSEPVLEEALTELRALTPSYARNGNVYFALRDSPENVSPDPDLYMVEPLENGGYSEPRSLGPNVNSEFFEAWHFIHPDEKYIIFSSYARPTGDGLYISYRNHGGSWQPARWLGDEINGGGQARMPRLSPDGKYLFFNRSGRNRYPDHSESPLTFEELIARTVGPRNGPGDIWWVDAAALDEIRELEHPDIRRAMLDAIDAEGAGAAIELYGELRRRHPTYYDAGEGFLNSLGHELLSGGRTAEAIAILELNVEVFPESANPHDSLAEAYMAAGDNAAAIKTYRKALAIRPTMPSAIRALRTLTGE